MKIVVNPDIDKIPALLLKVTHWLESKKIEPIIINQIKVAIDEVVSNTIKYGQIGVDKLEQSIDLSLNKDEVSITFMDNGRQFNPLTIKSPKLNQDINMVKVGGLGVYIFKNIMDDCVYLHQKGWNILTLVKRLT